MKVQIQKWGNSLALRIPSSFARETHIEEGSTVEMSLGKNGIFLKPLSGEISLDELLAKVTETNIHTEFDFGRAEGAEAW
jgi:antitoxin MazE